MGLNVILKRPNVSSNTYLKQSKGKYIQYPISYLFHKTPQSIIQLSLKLNLQYFTKT